MDAHEQILASAPSPKNEPENREQHNARQAAVFSGEGVNSFTQPLPDEVEERLKRIAAMARSCGSRTLDVGTGTGVLAGMYGGEVVGVDVSEDMLDAAPQYDGVEYWCGDIVDYASEKPFDSAVFNACFGNVYDQTESLAAAAANVKPGGSVFATHPLGANFVRELKEKDDTVVRHEMPRSLEEAQAMAPPFLRAFELVDSDDFYSMRWMREPYADMDKLHLRGPVAQGYGRGSKKLGFPTANLPETLFADQAIIQDLQAGVYIGFAQLRGQIYTAVSNIGYSPTFEGAENPTKIVEAYLCDYSSSDGDFYDEQLDLLLVGYLRPEKKFSGVEALVDAISNDVEMAKHLLKQPQFAHLSVSHPALAPLSSDSPKTVAKYYPE